MDTKLYEYLIEELKSQHKEFRIELSQLRNQMQELEIQITSDKGIWKVLIQVVASGGAIIASGIALLK